MAASALVAERARAAIVVPGMVAGRVQTGHAHLSDESMEDWAHRLCRSLAGALQSQLKEMLRRGR